MCIRDSTNTPGNKENPETALANAVITEFPLAFTNIAFYQQQEMCIRDRGSRKMALNVSFYISSHFNNKRDMKATK